MKRFLILFGLFLLLSTAGACTSEQPQAQIAATTLPVYDFTMRLCQDTGITVTRLVNESVSCLHDYSLSVSQVKAIEGAQLVVLSGAGLEASISNILESATTVIDASEGIPLLSCSEHHDHEHSDHHHHEADPHIWLSPKNAKMMAENICSHLIEQFPAHTAAFQNNLAILQEDFDALQTYGKEQLSTLTCRELVTFHDGFSYLAEAFDLTILEALEEESGSEASAAELKHLVKLIDKHRLPAVFTERSGSVSAAGVIHAETGVKVFSLDMSISGNSYFDAMYNNIDTIKEALG